MNDRQQQIREELARLDTRRRRLRKELRGYKAERIGTVIRKGRGCRDRDEELKARRGYTNPSSYVRRDGSEVLKGEDWKKRVEELRERSGGRCEHQEPTPDNPRITHRCSMPSRDPHHKIKRSVRRDDRLTNLEDLCRPHHDERDERKPRWSRKVEA